MRRATRRPFGLVIILLCAVRASASDKTTVQTFMTEPATLVSLGFEWLVDGVRAV
jgi:hypothetical protein